MPPDIPDDENLPTEAGGTGRGRLAIYCLLGLVGFLLALIGVIAGARAIRRPAAEQESPSRPATLGEWIEQLKQGPDEQARREAAKAIVAEGPAAVIAALDATTKFPAEGVAPDFSEAVVRAMAGRRGAAVDALSEALGSEKENVRAAAASILREIGPEARGAIGPLIGALDDRNRWIRWYAVEAIGNIGPDAAEAVDALLPLVDHEERATRRRAIAALGRIGPAARTALPRLTEVRQDDRDVDSRRAARIALYQIDLESIAAESAERAGGEIRELMAKLRSADQHESVAAANRLGELGGRAFEAVPSLAWALKDENKWLREAAAKALGSMGREARVIAFALEKAVEDAEPEVRTAATQALERIEGE